VITTNYAYTVTLVFDFPRVSFFEMPNKRFTFNSRVMHLTGAIGWRQLACDSYAPHKSPELFRATFTREEDAKMVEKSVTDIILELGGEML
jgi:hypothetical protein